MHPITQTHQFRPTLTYLDVLSRKSKRGQGDSDSEDDGPPPDPDDPTPVVERTKKEKKVLEAREVQVSARKAEDKSGLQLGAGLSTARKEMLVAIHAEEDESWQSLTVCSEEVCLDSYSKSLIFNKPPSGLWPCFRRCVIEEQPAIDIKLQHDLVFEKHPWPVVLALYQ